MSFENPVNLADFDYSDPKKVSEYVFTIKKIKETNEIWDLIQEKLLLLDEIKNQADRNIAIADLEVMRASAIELLNESDECTKNFLPDIAAVVEIEKQKREAELQQLNENNFNNSEEGLNE